MFFTAEFGTFFKRFEYQKLKDLAVLLIYISAIALAAFSAISIALSNGAIVIGAIGLVVLIFSKQLKFQKNDIPIAMIQLQGFLASALSINPIHNLLNFQYIWHFLPYYITSRIKQNIHILLNILAVSILISAFGLYFSAFFGIKPTDVLNLNTHLSFDIYQGPFGFTGCASYASIMLVFGTFIFGLLGIEKKNIFYMAVAVFAFFGVILAQERQDWLGFAVATLCLPIFFKNKRLVIIIYSVFFILFVLAYNLSFVKNRINQTIHFGHDASIVIRFAMIKGSKEVFKDASLYRKLFGYGPGKSFKSKTFPVIVKNYKELSNIYKVPKYYPGLIPNTIDNFYFKSLVSSGLVGIGLILSAFFLLLKTNIKAIRQSSGSKKKLLLGITLGLIAFYTASFFDNLLGSAQVSIFLCFVLGINSLILQS